MTVNWVTQIIGAQSIAMGSAMMQANRFCSFSSTSDGLSNTVLIIEDAGRPYRYGRGFTKRGPDSDGNDAGRRICCTWFA